MLTPLLQRFLGRPRLRFPYAGSPMTDARYTELASKSGWSKVQLPVAAGITLRGLVREPGRDGAPWVLFYPGNDDSQLERGQAFLIRMAGETDWGLAVFADRGYDSSDGKSELAAIRADAPAILDKFCALRAVPANRVHLAGFSIGGHFAVHAARGAAERGRRAASLTLLAPVDDIIMFTHSPWEKLSPGEDYQTRPFLSGVPAPVLVLQGGADVTLDGPKQGQDIAKALGDRARYRELPGVGHVELLESREAVAAARDFIQENAK